MPTSSGYVTGEAEWQRRWRSRSGELRTAGAPVAVSTRGRVDGVEGQQWQLVDFGRALVDCTTGKTVAVTDARALAAGRCQIRTRNADLFLVEDGGDWDLWRGDSLVASISKRRGRHRWAIECQGSMLPVAVVVFAMEIIGLVGRMRRDQKRFDNRALRRWRSRRQREWSGAGFEGLSVGSDPDEFDDLGWGV